MTALRPSIPEGMEALAIAARAFPNATRLLNAIGRAEGIYHVDEEAFEATRYELDEAAHEYLITVETQAAYDFAPIARAALGGDTSPEDQRDG